MVRVLRAREYFIVVFLSFFIFFSGCQKSNQGSSTASSDTTAFTKAPAGRSDATGVSFIKFAIKGDELNKLNIKDFSSLADVASFYNLYSTQLTGDNFADFTARLSVDSSGASSHPPVEVTFLDNDVEIGEATVNGGLANEYKLITVENIPLGTRILFEVNQTQFQATLGQIKYLSFRGYQLERGDDTHFNLVPVYYLFGTRGERFSPEFNADFTRATFNAQFFRVSKRAAQ